MQYWFMNWSLAAPLRIRIAQGAANRYPSVGARAVWNSRVPREAEQAENVFVAGERGRTGENRVQHILRNRTRRLEVDERKFLDQA